MQIKMTVNVCAVPSLTAGKHYAYVNYGPAAEGEARDTRYVLIDTPEGTTDPADFARDVLASIIEAL